MADDPELASAVQAVTAAGEAGCPVAGDGRPDQVEAIARRALRRWRSVGRRLPAPAARDARVEDLAKGLRDTFERDRRSAGPLIEDYRYLARCIADALDPPVVMPPPGFATPEEAALSGWSASAQAFVLDRRVESSTVAWVLVDTTPSHPMLVCCHRSDEGWHSIADQSYDDHLPPDWRP